MNWMLIFTGMVAVSTVVYAILTWRLVSETRKMGEQSVEPYIIASLILKSDWISDVVLRIENVGAGAARDICLSLDKDIPRYEQKPLLSLTVLENGIPVLGPGQHFDLFIASGLTKFWEDIDSPIILTAKYRGTMKKVYESESIIDFEIFKDAEMVDDNLNRSIVQKLDMINSTLRDRLVGAQSTDGQRFKPS